MENTEQIKPTASERPQLFVTQLGDFNGGLITFPAPESIRGTYDVGSGGIRPEYWGDQVKITVQLFRQKSMERHLSYAKCAHIFLDSETGELQQVVVRYASQDGRALSYDFNTITRLRGVSLTLFGIGTFQVRDHHFFN